MREEFTDNAEQFEDEQVSATLQALHRVDAPADFDIRVKARIASRHSEKSSAAGWLFPRLAIPAGFAALILGASVIYFNSTRNIEIADVETPQTPIVENTITTDSVAAKNNENLATATEREVLPESSGEVATIEKTVGSGYAVARNASERNLNQRSSSLAVEEVRPGSIDRMLRLPEEVININDIKTARAFPSTSANDTLRKAGINAEIKDGVWQILSVSEGSVAARSGLTARDKIESVDGRKPASSPLFVSDHKIRSVVVRNDDGSFKVLNFGN